jgi:hypothetical protein
VEAILHHVPASFSTHFSDVVLSWLEWPR